MGKLVIASVLPFVVSQHQSSQGSFGPAMFLLISQMIFRATLVEASPLETDYVKQYSS